VRYILTDTILLLCFRIATCQPVKLRPYFACAQQYKHGVGDFDFDGPIWNTL